MQKAKLLFLGMFFFNHFISTGQNIDSVILKVNGVESKELLDYYRFEGINYYKMKVTGDDIKSQYFILTSNEFWNGKSVKVDTIANTKIYQIKNGLDTLDFRVMSKKINRDTIKFQFHLPRFSTEHKFKTTIKNTYSLRDITSNGEQTFAAKEPINLLVYSLPYEDPARPGYFFYCELSREGTPPELWGEKFGVNHYIIFKLQFIN